VTLAIALAAEASCAHIGHGPLAAFPPERVPLRPDPLHDIAGMPMTSSGSQNATVVIYHNPACGTSRNTLARIREAGIEPQVVEYLKEGWTKPQLKEILKKLGKTPRDILRLRGNEAHEHIINNPNSTDDEILDAMVGHPILVERPIVITPKGAVLARPADQVDSIL
jgi:arsenate reductase